MRHAPLSSCVWRKRRMRCSCGVWVMTHWLLILPEFLLTHVLLSDTLSSYRAWPQTHSCFLWSYMQLSAIKPNHTHSSCMLLTCRTHILSFFPEHLLLHSLLLKMTRKAQIHLFVLKSSFDVFRSNSWRRQHLVAENVTAGTGQQSVEIRFKKGSFHTCTMGQI